MQSYNIIPMKNIVLSTFLFITLISGAHAGISLTPALTKYCAKLDQNLNYIIGIKVSVKILTGITSEIQS